MWIRIVADRSINKIVDFECIKTTHFSTYFKNSFLLIYQYKMKHLCTYGYDVHSKNSILKKGGNLFDSK